MKILYLGSDVYYDTFKYLVENHEVIALYTYHNDEDYFNEYEVVKLANKHNVSVHYENLEANVIVDYFQNKGVNLIFSAEYDRIIPTPDIKEFRAVNVHGSLLPIGRGYYPIESAFDLNENRCGVTIHELISKVDQGKILFQYAYPIDKKTSSIDCYIKNAKAVRGVVEDLINNIDDYFDSGVAQTQVLPYWKKPVVEHLTITHELSVIECEEIYRKYNKLSQILIDNKKYYVVSLIGSNEEVENDYIIIGNNSFIYKVKDGYIQLELLEVKNDEWREKE